MVSLYWVKTIILEPGFPDICSRMRDRSFSIFGCSTATRSLALASTSTHLSSFSRAFPALFCSGSSLNLVRYLSRVKAPWVSMSSVACSIITACDWTSNAPKRYILLLELFICMTISTLDCRSIFFVTPLNLRNPYFLSLASFSA